MQSIADTARLLEDHAHEIKTRGYTIIEDVLDTEQVNAARAALDEIFQREAGLARPHGWHDSRNTVTFMLLQKDALFRSIIQGTKLLPLMRSLLGDDCIISSLNGLSMTPGGETQHLHRDSLGIPGHVLAINALHTLDDFTIKNGCTRLVPYSQDVEVQLLGRVDEANFVSFEEKSVYLQAPAGSVIAYNGAILHAGSRNSTNEPRRSLHAFFTRSWIKPQWDIAASLSPQVLAELTAEQKKLYGFYSSPRRYDYRTDEVVVGVTCEKKHEGIRQHARKLKSWLLEQIARSRRRT